MRLHGQIIKRMSWNPQDITSLPFEVDHISELYPLLEQIAEDRDTLLITIDIWNKTKLAELRAQGN